VVKWISHSAGANVHDLFISYSIKNRFVAEAAKHFLEDNGIRCWKAPDNILPGQDWAEAITDAIMDASILLLIWSSDSMSSDQVKRELTLAANSSKTIIPFRIEEIIPKGAFAFYLSTTHWLDAFDNDVEIHFSRLVSRILPIIKATDGEEIVSHVSGYRGIQGKCELDKNDSQANAQHVFNNISDQHSLECAQSADQNPTYRSYELEPIRLAILREYGDGIAGVHHDSDPDACATWHSACQANIKTNRRLVSSKCLHLVSVWISSHLPVKIVIGLCEASLVISKEHVQGGSSSFSFVDEIPLGQRTAYSDTCIYIGRNRLYFGRPGEVSVELDRLASLINRWSCVRADLYATAKILSAEINGLSVINASSRVESRLAISTYPFCDSPDCLLSLECNLGNNENISFSIEFYADFLEFFFVHPDIDIPVRTDRCFVSADVGTNYKLILSRFLSASPYPIRELVSLLSLWEETKPSQNGTFASSVYSISRRVSALIDGLLYHAFAEVAAMPTCECYHLTQNDVIYSDSGYHLGFSPSISLDIASYESLNVILCSIMLVQSGNIAHGKLAITDTPCLDAWILSSEIDGWEEGFLLDLREINATLEKQEEGGDLCFNDDVKLVMNDAGFRAGLTLVVGLLTAVSGHMEPERDWTLDESLERADKITSLTHRYFPGKTNSAFLEIAFLLRLSAFLHNICLLRAVSIDVDTQIAAPDHHLVTRSKMMELWDSLRSLSMSERKPYSNGAVCDLIDDVFPLLETLVSSSLGESFKGFTSN
jgi:hypothetical protein